MNKKQTAEFELAKKMAREAIALGWPSEPEPKPMSSEEIESKKSGHQTPVKGWFMNDHLGSWSQLPTMGCSSGSSHSRDNPEKTCSQGMGQIYRTEEDALIALRWGLCRRMAEMLARVDARRREILS